MQYMGAKYQASINKYIYLYPYQANIFLLVLLSNLFHALYTPSSSYSTPLVIINTTGSGSGSGFEKNCMRMKNKAAGLLKKMMAIFATAKTITDLKSKLRDLKTRLMIYSLLSRDKKVLFGSISHKFRDLLLTNHHHQPVEQPIDQTEQQEKEEQSNLHQQVPLVICNNIINAATLPPTIVKKVRTGHEQRGDEDEEQKKEIRSCTSNQEDEEENQGEEEEDGNYDQKDKYPDLRHSLFEDEDDEFEMGRPGSVIELVKKSKEAQKGGDLGEEFKLEDEIDEVADLFIKSFHRHMWIQKQNSFKRRTAHPTKLI